MACALPGDRDRGGDRRARRRVSGSISMREGDRFRARESIAELIGAWIGAQPFDAVQRTFDAHGVCWSRYQTVEQLVREDPACSEANPMFQRIDQPGVGRVLAPGSPLRFSAFPRLRAATGAAARRAHRGSAARRAAARSRRLRSARRPRHRRGLRSSCRRSQPRRLIALCGPLGAGRCRNADAARLARRRLAGDHQRDAAEDRGRRDDEAQRDRLAEQRDAAERRDHRHAELDRRRARHLQAAQRRVPDRVADAGRQRARRDRVAGAGPVERGPRQRREAERRPRMRRRAGSCRR